MLAIVMAIYALLLFGVAGYLFMHRTRNFIMFKKPSHELANSMTITSVLLTICGIASLVVGIMGQKWLALIVIAISLLFTFTFASGLTRSMNQ